MNFKTPLFIALRYWRSKSGDRFGRLVANLASFGIVLGVMALVIVQSVMNGLVRQQEHNLLSTLPHAVVSHDLQNFERNRPLVLPDLVDRAVDINRASVIIQSQQGINAGSLIGVQHASDDPLLSGVENLEQLLPEGAFNVVVNVFLAEELRLKVGDKIRLLITENSQYTPFGRVPVQRLFTISGISYFHNYAATYTLFANLTDVGRLLRIPAEEVQGKRLFLNEPFEVPDLVKYYPTDEFKLNDWRDQKGEFFQAIKMERNMMSLLISLIIVVAVSNIVTSLSLMVVDKQGEIAILQTQGLTKAQVTQIFVIQGSIVGIVGALLGGLLGWLATTYLSDLIAFITPNGVVLPTEIKNGQVAFVVLSSIALSLLCTLYPAYRASKIEPAEALRYE